MQDYDIAIIGGGIVGLSTGMELTKKYPEAKIAVIEKENELAMHQTGHNSGVVHSGIYYKPGSFKAEFARSGNKSMVEFCQKYDISFEQCGKLIVATNENELPLLDNLYKRGLENKLDVHKIEMDEVKEIEPYLEGLKAIRVPSTGIVDFKQVTNMFSSLIKENGGEILLNTEVKNMEDTNDGVHIKTTKGNLKANRVVNCAGLQCDRVAEMAKVKTDMQIVPFRGEYYELKPEKRYYIKNLVYPVPNPDFPFLGVHFTRMVDGRILIGPNAVPGMKREGYKKSDFSINDFFEIITYSGFWKVALSNMKEGTKEIVRSLSKRLILKEIQRFIPDIQEEDLIPAEGGVRAQALEPNGKMVDDFFIVKTNNTVHVCNAPSPAATASIEIGKYIASQLEFNKRMSELV